MRLKTGLKVIVFILIFTVSLTAFTNLFITVDDLGYQNIAGFYEERENSLDAVYIGSSNCFTFWNSLLAWEEYGISVYPYSCNSNLFFSTEYIIKEVVKTQPNATFIVNINSLTDGDINIQQFRNLIDSMPFSLNKLALINHLSDIGDYSFSERLEFYLPIIRYHTRWNEISATDFSIELNGLKGASAFDIYLNVSNDITAAYVTTALNAELSNKIVSSTESLLDYCEKEKINVTFVTVPQARGNEYDMSRYNALNTMIQDRGFDVLDLTERLDDIGLDMTKDYYNGAHTNIHGSIKYTYFLSEYLIDKNAFTDKRGNSEYSDWDTAYSKYLKEISPYVLDVEIDSAARTYSLEEPVMEAVLESSQITVSWNKIQNADGYLVYRKTGISSPWEKLTETAECSYTDISFEDGKTFYYTVVPFLVDENVQYYGDFNYGGVSVSLENI